MSANQVAFAYLVASVLFILALKGLSHPETARRGNLFGIVGMTIAVLTTLALSKTFLLIVVAIAIGALIQIAPPLDAAGATDRPNALILGLAVFALALTAINMFGGFAVTRRMLAMFRK